MRNSERVLNSLAIHSRQPNYKFERLYRLLFNEQMYYAAYQRIYAKEGNVTKGADNATIDHMSISRIEKTDNFVERRVISAHTVKESLYSQEEWEETTSWHTHIQRQTSSRSCQNDFGSDI